MGKTIDLTDKTFYEWYVIRRATSKEIEEAGLKNRGACWLCRCSCGKEKIVIGYNLRTGNHKSCGHASVINETGNVYGKLRVERRITGEEKILFGLEESTSAYWLCKCECGEQKIYSGYVLRSGKVNSCGCERRRDDIEDETGNVYGRYKVIRRATKEEERNRTKGVAFWECECLDCHNKYIVPGRDLRSGHSKSCGCSREIDETGNTYGKLKVIKKADYNSKVRTGVNWVCECSCGNVVVRAGVQLRRDKSMNISSSCGACNNGTSTAEQLFKKEITLDKRVLINDRSKLNGKEIDIYVPDKNIGIEFNGNYWHSELEKDKYYHQNKTELARSKGIELIHVFEYEWNDERKHDIIVNTLKDKIHDTKVINSDNCEIRTVSLDEQISFNNKYHLDGNTGSMICYGMYYDGELVSLMSFGKPRKRDEKAFWEMLRYTTKFGISIKGGAYRMLYEFRKERKGNIVVYIDACKNNGSWAKELGFEYVALTEPEYVWYDTITGRLLDNSYYNKQKLLAMKWGTQDQRVEDILKNTGHVRIFDSGKYKYIMQN